MVTIKSIEEKAKRYDEAYKVAENIHRFSSDPAEIKRMEQIFPELAESDDERIRKELIEFVKSRGGFKQEYIAWLEKQGSEPNWCHHKVDLSDCSEEYRKAYYDGWNNCNMQHSQCKSELDDVVKCLINGMKFYYEDNEEATWGTDKWSMPVKHIIEVLEKQGEQKPENYDHEMWKNCQANFEGGKNEVINNPEKYGLQKPVEPTDLKTWKYIVDAVLTEREGIGQYIDSPWTTDVAEKLQKRFGNIEQKPAWSEEDKQYLEDTLNLLDGYRSVHTLGEVKNWLKSLRPQSQWKPNDRQMKALKEACDEHWEPDGLDPLYVLWEQLKKLREE